MDLSDKEIGEIVKEIKKPIAKLEMTYAELTMAHAYFEVVTTLALYEGIATPEKIQERILDSYEAYLKDNPIPQVRSH